MLVQSNPSFVFINVHAKQTWLAILAQTMAFVSGILGGERACCVLLTCLYAASRLATRTLTNLLRDNRHAGPLFNRKTKGGDLATTSDKASLTTAVTTPSSTEMVNVQPAAIASPTTSSPTCTTGDTTEAVLVHA